MGSPSHLTEVRPRGGKPEGFNFFEGSYAHRQGEQQGERPPKTAARTEVGILECKALSGGDDLNLAASYLLDWKQFVAVVGQLLVSSIYIYIYIYYVYMCEQNPDFRIKRYETRA